MKSEAWWAENWDNHSLIKEEIKARSDARNGVHHVDQLQEAKALIKQVHANGGRILTDAEIEERYSDRQINLGRDGIVPYKKRAGGRGRPPKNRVGTAEDVAYRHRLATYHKRFVLPRLRLGSGYIDHEEIKLRFRQLHETGVKRHKLVSDLMEELDKLERNRSGFCPNESTLRRILKQTAL